MLDNSSTFYYNIVLCKPKGETNLKKLHENLTPEEKNSLKGHRERLRKRYLTQDEDYMDTNRLLELLLTYAIPRQDVYMLANSLLSRFGDIGGVLNASVDELMLVDGIGQTAAILISLVSSLNRKKLLSEISCKTFENTDQIARDICKLFYDSNEERVLVVAFNSSMRMLSHQFVSRGQNGECVIDNREIAKFILKDGISSIIIAHNHPSGNVNPSAEDIRAMFELEMFLNSMSVKLIDMLIVSGDSYFKMSDAEKLSNRLADTLGEEPSYIFDKLISPERSELTSGILDF